MNQATTTLASNPALDVKSVHRFSDISSDRLMSHTLSSLICTSKKTVEMQPKNSLLGHGLFSTPNLNKAQTPSCTPLPVEATQTCNDAEVGRQYGAVGPTEISNRGLAESVRHTSDPVS